jgi:hypothetical protein
LVKLKQPKKQFSTLVKNTKKAQKISYADMAQSVERRLGKIKTTKISTFQTHQNNNKNDQNNTHADVA